MELKNRHNRVWASIEKIVRREEIIDSKRQIKRTQIEWVENQITQKTYQSSSGWNQPKEKSLNILKRTWHERIQAQKKYQTTLEMIITVILVCFFISFEGIFIFFKNNNKIER